MGFFFVFRHPICACSGLAGIFWGLQIVWNAGNASKIEKESLRKVLILAVLVRNPFQVWLLWFLLYHWELQGTVNIPILAKYVTKNTWIGQSNRCKCVNKAIRTFTENVSAQRKRTHRSAYTLKDVVYDKSYFLVIILLVKNSENRCAFYGQ